MEELVTQIKLMLVIFGDSFSPDEITQLIKVNPENSWVKGEPIPKRNGLNSKDNMMRLRQESAWEFSTGFIKTVDFENVSSLFEKKFGDKISILKSYIKRNRLETVLNIVVEIVDEEKPSIHFNKKLIKICEELNLEIDIDMYLLNRN